MALYNIVPSWEKEMFMNGESAFADIKLPTPLSKPLEEVRQTLGVEPGDIESLLIPEDQHSTRKGSYTLNWELDDQTGLYVLGAKSNIPPELSDKSRTQVRSILAWRRVAQKCPELPQHDLVRKEIWERRQDQKAIVGTQKQDLALWIATRNYLGPRVEGTAQEQAEAMEVLEKFLYGYYANIGLRTRKKDDEYLKADTSNWNAAAALAVVWHSVHTNQSPRYVMSRYRVQPEKVKSVENTTRQIKNNVWWEFWNKNARIIGRAFLIDYFNQRNEELKYLESQVYPTDFQRARRVVDEIVLGSSYGIPAGIGYPDVYWMGSVATLPDELLRNTVSSILS